MGKYDAVVFDMDGTLLDTLDDLTDCVNAMMIKYGYPERTKEEVRSFVGTGVARLISLSIPGGKENPAFENCLADYIAYYRANMLNKTTPFAGISAALETLCSSGCKLAIVSNKFDKAVRELNQLFFDDYIKVAIGESEEIKKKPAPDSIYKALEELGVDPKKAAYVGDSEVDIQTAKNAGVAGIGVTWGFRGRKVLETEGADFIVDTPEELLKVLA